MTVKLVSKSSIEMQLVLVCIFSLALGATFGLCHRLDVRPSNRLSAEELPESASAIVDEARPLSDKLLDSIVREYSERVKHTMDSEMGSLIGELQLEASGSAAPTHAEAEDEQQLDRLKRANEQASDEIKTRIGLASDTSGALPQWSPGQAAADLVSAASWRLQAVGSFTGDKLRSLTGRVSKKIPARLRRFFTWPSFASFKSKFKKFYTPREELYRQMIYLRNQVVVGIQRVRFLFRRDKHITKATQFADWTREEYNEVYNNREAETEADVAQFGSLDEAAKAKLLQVASSGRNVFGQAIAERPVKRTRTKRDTEDDDYDELADSEEDDLSVLLEDDGLDEESAMSAEEEFELLEQFSNANMTDDDDLTKASDLADEALALNSDFKPIDLRDTSCISESENQDNCGNCYAQVIVSAAWYYRCMASRGQFQTMLHTRFVSDCGKFMQFTNGKQPHIRGCRGGRMSHAFEFAKAVGMQRYGDYQMARLSQKNWDSDECAYTKPEDINNTGWRLIPIEQFRQSRYINIQLDEVDLHLRSIGPVFCNIRAWPGFKEFGGGIYDGRDITEAYGIHSVLIVGHDIDSKGRHYYIVKNSHGIAWGEDGFFRIYNESLRNFGTFYAGLAPLAVE